MQCLFVRLGIMACVFSCSNVSAEIYSWKDDNGRLHYSDKPVSGYEAEVVELQHSLNTYNAPEIVEIMSNSNTAPGPKKVVLYSASWCGVCKQAKRYFKSRNIAFREYDVEKNSRARKEFERLGGRGVPVIMVGKSRINGFSKQAFDKLYYRQGR